VAIQEKILIPVGTAITIVAAVKYALVSTNLVCFLINSRAGVQKRNKFGLCLNLVKLY